MNKIILKVNLIGENAVKLTLVYLTKDFMNNSEELLYYHTDDYSFVVHSGEYFSMTDSSLRLPYEYNYKSGDTTKMEFKSNKERFECLKNLHICLHEWANRHPKFKNDTQFNKILFSNEYWII